MRLDELFESVETSMHLPVMDLSATAESYDESPELVVSFCSLYHLSRLIVPAFEVTVTEQRLLLLSNNVDTASAVCTKVVFYQAMSFTGLLQQMLAKNMDITRLWPFTGYAAFFVGHVFLVCNQSKPWYCLPPKLTEEEHACSDAAVTGARG